MAERRPSLMEPRIEALMDKVDSKFTLVTLSAMRAREINDYYNQLGEGLGRIVPPQVTSVSRKPLSIALEEVAAGKIVYERIEPEEEAAPPTRSPPPTSSPTPGPDRRTEMHRVVLGVCGGIAAYKAVDVCRRLVDAGVHVAPVLTDDAQRFVGAVTFSALASEPAHTSLFSGPDPIPHTTLGQSADLIVVAPATAKLLGKYAAGISDDLLTATLLATRAPVLVCPAMHTEMWEHAAVQENLATLRRRGVHVLEPEAGRLAGGDVGAGRLADPGTDRGGRVGAARPARAIAGGPPSARDCRRDTRGDRSRCVTSGIGRRGRWATRSRTRRRGAGARVVLVTTSSVPSAPDVEIVRVESAEQMHDAVLARFGNSDVVVMAAAVADFRPKAVAAAEVEEARRRTRGRARTDRRHPRRARAMPKRGDQVVVGFAAETEQLRERAAAKLAAKRVDLMVANDVSAPDAGFEVDTNRAVLLDASGGAEETPLLTKVALAGTVLDRVEELLASRGRGGSL